jgi:hypothetical protein
MWANEQRQQVVDFGEDRRAPGRGLVREIWARVQGFRTHPYAPAQGKDPSITFNGLAAAPQDFSGLGQLAVGGLPYRNDGFATLDTGLVEGPLGDPSRRIFAQRLARRAASGGGA